MWFNISKFTSELKMLRALKKDPGLSLFRQRALKEQLLSRLNTAKNEGAEEYTFVSVNKQRIWYYAAAPLALVLLASGTIFASAKSLPGEPLYGVKKLKEKVEAVVAIGETAQAQMEAKHAATRLEELVVVSNQVETILPQEPVAAKTKVEKLEVEVTNQAHVQLEKALNVLNDVGNKLEDKGETKAATQIKQKIDELTAKATSTVFEVEVEKEYGRYQVRIKSKSNNRDKNDNEYGNSSDNSNKQTNNEEESDKSDDSNKIELKIELPSNENSDNDRADTDRGRND